MDVTITDEDVRAGSTAAVHAAIRHAVNIEAVAEPVAAAVLDAVVPGIVERRTAAFRADREYWTRLTVEERRKAIHAEAERDRLAAQVATVRRIVDEILSQPKHNARRRYMGDLAEQIRETLDAA